MFERLTYKSMLCGDYGSAKEYDSPYDEIQTLRDALGPYEDIGLTPKEICEQLKLNGGVNKNEN